MFVFKYGLRSIWLFIFILVLKWLLFFFKLFIELEYNNFFLESKVKLLIYFFNLFKIWLEIKIVLFFKWSCFKVLNSLIFELGFKLVVGLFNIKILGLLMSVWISIIDFFCFEDI